MPKLHLAIVLLAIAVCASTIWLHFALKQQAYIVSRGETEMGRYIDLVSETYLLDQPFMSMQGPRGNHPRIRLDDDADVEDTLWITGIETINVDANSGQRESNEFFCHSNLTFCPQSTSPENHNQSFQVPRHMDWRLFTLVPGRMTVDLPDGFGIPIRGASELDYFTMALNQNQGPEHQIQMKTRIRYQRDSDSQPIRPLFRRALYVYQQHLETSGHDSSRHDHGHDHRHRGEDCAEQCDLDLASTTPSTFLSVVSDQKLDHHPGATCCVVNASQDGITDQFGAENTVHWMVPPGRHEYTTEVTEQMQLPFDTTVHYVTGHLHPYGRSLTLKDLDNGQILFEISATDYQDRLGVANVTQTQSRPGIPIRRDGRYELIAGYDNSTSHDIDAMGILYVYALDDEPNRPLVKCPESALAN